MCTDVFRKFINVFFFSMMPAGISPAIPAESHTEIPSKDTFRIFFSNLAWNPESSSDIIPKTSLEILLQNFNEIYVEIFAKA